MEYDINDFTLFLGRFHPLVVHLPIGFLLFAFLLEAVGRFKSNGTYLKAVPLALLSGAFSALLACIFGYLLSQSGDYDAAMVDTHFWLGVAVTILSFAAWLIRSGRWGLSKWNRAKPNITLLALVVVLLGATGHYGGNLTHGTDYLVKYAPFGKGGQKQLPPVATMGEAGMYDYLIDPILQDKCASCHNESKKKGGLSYENFEALMMGGEDGPVLQAGNSKESEMIKRVLLTEDHEDVMPPEGKTPLTEEELALLSFWIDKADAKEKITLDSLDLPENISLMAANRLGLGIEKSRSSRVSNGPVVDISLLTELETLGFKVREMADGSNLFDITLQSGSGTINDVPLGEKLEKLREVRNNIIWLTLSDSAIGDDELKKLQGFQNLILLKLDNNPITDDGITVLKEFDKLESLNMYGTKISNKSLSLFAALPNLKKVFVWNTSLTPEDVLPYADSKHYPELIFGS